MKRILISAIFLFATACTFQVDVVDTPTPQPPAALEVVASSTLPASLNTPDISATPPPLPTLSATSTPLVLPSVIPETSISPIQFGPNGTYVDVLDNIMGETSKTYSVNAMKGQVMSVSFHLNEDSPWTYITMRIIGADGSVLCAGECEFWRGLLPTTQNYFLIVTPAAQAVNFTMRIAINPPGVATQFFPYENIYSNASLSYTDMFAPAFFPGPQVSRIEPELTLQFIDTQSYAGTNLSEAYFLFGSSTDAQIVSTCTQTASLGGPETVVGNVTINDVPFTKSEGNGVGAGNIYEQTYYRTAQNGTCYEITYFIHYTNVGNYEPGTVEEFDRDALIQNFDQILSTFVLK